VIVEVPVNVRVPVEVEVPIIIEVPAAAAACAVCADNPDVEVADNFAQTDVMHVLNYIARFKWF